MTLRTHQDQARSIALRIRSGEKIKFILMSVTPGGGKSGIPPIFAEILIPDIVDSLLWVVPRKSLQSQGEGEFLEPMWGTNHRIRMADNSSEDICRGLSGYITTYQGIASRPWLHIEEFKKKKYIIFLDEEHHVGEDPGSMVWADSLKPLIEMAVIVVFMSGTLARGDGKPIAFLPYENGVVKVPNDWERIDYTRSQAIKEGAILPVYFKTFDAHAKWKDKEGNTLKAKTLKISKKANEALFSALSTEFAFEIIESTIDHWLDYKKNVFNRAKLLIVAPNINLANKYHRYLKSRGYESLIATSEDDKEAEENIKRFKGIREPEIDILDTVAMAYEGLSVKPATHIACLTHIRSIPWLEQLFARVNRLDDGKTCGWVFGPMDKNFEDAIISIEKEQQLAIEMKEKREREGSGGLSERKEIIPLQSGAIGVNIQDVINQELPMSPSEEEEFLKKEIEDHISKYVKGKRYDKRHVNKSIKNIFGKSRTEMTIPELKDVLGYLRNIYHIKENLS